MNFLLIGSIIKQFLYYEMKFCKNVYFWKIYCINKNDLAFSVCKEYTWSHGRIDGKSKAILVQITLNLE